MRLVLSVAGFALALAACGSEKSGTFETEDAEGSYAVDSEDGTVSSTITTDEGTATMQSGANVKAKLPEGFTIFPGSEVVSATNVSSGEGVVTSVMLRAKVDPDQFTSFYRNQAERAGIVVDTEMSINGNKTLAGKGKDGTSFSLTASKEEGEDTSIAQLSVSKGLMK